MKDFLMIVGVLILEGGLLATSCEQDERCARSTCSSGKKPRMVASGRYSRECLCVEVPL